MDLIEVPWNPLQNIDDAWMLVEKFGGMERFDFQRIKFLALMPINIYDITPKSICESAIEAVS
ncbi:hypothetical protein [Brevibacillus nitrificans]|uniref:hypothetical protein n=1 Tax=Brevibacillus nitrificans TaxID=651560 RepID=UPI00260E7D72|nr:hypothetical protein [Brevibacillus nitrificans]MED1795163.1 hypothetical protein [Brevibacillus nitrificans]